MAQYSSTKTGAASGGGTFGAYAGWFQLANTLASGYFQRQSMRLTARQVQFQNGINARQNALSIANARNQYTVARAMAGLSRAEAAANNKIRQANNLRANVDADLTNWTRSVQNQRRMEAAGNAQLAGVTNLLRSRDQQTNESLESRLSAAETIGALAANAALSGTGGSSIDGMERAVRLRDQRSQHYADKQAGLVDYDALAQIAGIVPQAASGMDLTVTQANQDFGHDVGQFDPLPPTPTVSFAQNWQNPWGNPITDAATWFMDPNNAAAARQMGDQLSGWFSSKKTDYPGI